MALKVRRDTKGVRRQARAQGASRTVGRARRQGHSLVAGMLAALPFSEEQLRRVFTIVILGGMAVLLVFLANISGASAAASERFAQIAANAGFKVVHVVPRGTDRLNQMIIYEMAFRQKNLAMTQVDVTALRDNLLTLPWVKDARVSRQLPDTLVIDIVEREPHAVLRRGERLVLIDPAGVELEAAGPTEVQEMLLLEGEGAQGQVEALAQLLDAAPALRQKVIAASWVGDRRWDVTFDTGQRLSLPEGEELAAAALISFAQADGVHRLIGGEVGAFDLRNPPRLYMRVPGREERAQLEMEGDL